MAFRIGKALEKSWKKSVNTVKQTVTDPERAVMAMLTAGQSVVAEAGIESLGAFGSEAQRALYGEAPAELDLSAPDASSEEKRRKKAIEEAARLNSPGVQSQTVLNVR